MRPRLQRAFHRLPPGAQGLARRVWTGDTTSAPGTNAGYWSAHNVTAHRRFDTRRESLDYLNWRNAQYLFYDRFLPYSSMAGKVVLDYGCGPGDDLAAVAEWGNPARLIGADVSAVSLGEATARLMLHDQHLEPVVVDEHEVHLPLGDSSVDFVVSSGVLHHCPNVGDILEELRRVLRPGGQLYVMVYNADSVWLHLYVAYLRQIVARIDGDMPLAEAFKRSTDGPGCPYSVAYRSAEFLQLAADHGFAGESAGAAVAVDEMRWLERRFDAIADRRLAEPHRDFLSTLTFDEWGRPLADGAVAGIDGLFVLRPARADRPPSAPRTGGPGRAGPRPLAPGG